jgi:hypothetical protein
VRGGKAYGTLVGLHSLQGKLAGDRLGAVTFLFKCLLVFDLGCLNMPRDLMGNGMRVVELCPDKDEFPRAGLCSVSQLLEFILKRVPLLNLPPGDIGSIRARVRRELISDGGKVALKGGGAVTFGGEVDYLLRCSGHSVTLLLELPSECPILLRSRSGGLHCFYTRKPSRVEFRPSGRKFVRKDLCLVLLLFEFPLKGPILFHHCSGSSRCFGTRGLGRIAFGPKGSKVARKAFRSNLLLFELPFNDLLLRRRFRDSLLGVPSRDLRLVKF